MCPMYTFAHAPTFTFAVPHTCLCMCPHTCLYMYPPHVPLCMPCQFMIGLGSPPLPIRLPTFKILINIKSLFFPYDLYMCSCMCPPPHVLACAPKMCLCVCFSHVPLHVPPMHAPACDPPMCAFMCTLACAFTHALLHAPICAFVHAPSHIALCMYPTHALAHAPIHAPVCASKHALPVYDWFRLPRTIRLLALNNLINIKS